MFSISSLSVFPRVLEHWTKFKVTLEVSFEACFKNGYVNQLKLFMICELPRDSTLVSCHQEMFINYWALKTQSKLSIGYKVPSKIKNAHPKNFRIIWLPARPFTFLIEHLHERFIFRFTWRTKSKTCEYKETRNCCLINFSLYSKNCFALESKRHWNEWEKKFNNNNNPSRQLEISIRILLKLSKFPLSSQRKRNKENEFQ